MPDAESNPSPQNPTSLSSLRSLIDRTIISSRLAANESQRLLTDANTLLAALSDESDLPEGDRQHAAKWRLLCRRLSIDPKVTHHTAIVHLRNPPQ